MGIILLLLGATTLFLAARSVLGDEPPTRAWRLGSVAVLAALVVIQLWVSSGAADRYRISLLGMRQPVLDVNHRLISRTLRVGGDSDSADLFVPGRLSPQLARLEMAADSEGLTRITGTAVPDAGVALLYRSGSETEWRVAGSRAFEPGDIVVIDLPSGPLRLVSEPISSSKPIRHRLRAIHNGSTVELPPMEGARPFLHSGRDQFRRVYLLMDILQEFDPARADPPVALSSFFYYDDNTLRLADLDSEVSAAAGRTNAPDTVWWRGGHGFMIALGLPPLREYRSYKLRPPERYGLTLVNPLRLRTAGRWLEVFSARPVIFALSDPTLGSLSLEEPGRAGASTWRIRLTANPKSLARKALFVGEVAKSLTSAGEVEFDLPRSTGEEQFVVRTPGGIAPWRLGAPLPLGRADGPALLLRVDRQAIDPALCAGVLAVFLLAAMVFVLPLTSEVFALALAGMAFASVRLVTGMGSFLAYPFADTYASSLWTIPLVPWVVVLMAEAGRWMTTTAPEALRPSRADATRWGLGCAALAGPLLLGWALGEPLRGAAVSGLLVLVLLGWDRWHRIQDGTGRAVLAGHTLLALAISGLGWLVSDTLMLPLLTMGFLVAALIAGMPWIRLGIDGVGRWRMTALLGSIVVLVGVRAMLGYVSHREMIPIGTTRFGLSIGYSPLLAILLALLLHRWNEGTPGVPNPAPGPEFAGQPADPSPPAGLMAYVRGAVSRVPRPRLAWSPAAPRLWSLVLLLGCLFGLAYVGVALLVSDNGIVFVGALGASVLLAFLALRVPDTHPGPWATRLLLVFPLFILLLVQVNPLVLGAPKFSDGMTEETLRMQEWENDELRLVERRHPEALIEIGHERSEALSIMRTVMRSYTRGGGNFAGRGFLGLPISGDIAVTAPREHVPSALIASYWGWLGTLGIILLLCTLLLPLCPLWPQDDGDPAPAGGRALVLFGGPALVLAVMYFLPVVPTALVLLAMVCGVAFLCWRERGGPDAGPQRLPLPWLPELIAASALATMVFASLYMILSNYGVTLFTGKNVYLLGLDSHSDLLESLALLGLAALAFSYHTNRPAPANPVSG